MSQSEYRRLFEAAQDGILILDVGTGRITDVTGGAAHDFNNILAGSWDIAICSNRATSLPVMLKYTNEIQLASERAADLTRQLLALRHDGIDVS